MIYSRLNKKVTLFTDTGPTICKQCTLYCFKQQQQPFNGLFSRTTWVSRYQIGKTNVDFTEARDNEW